MWTVICVFFVLAIVGNAFNKKKAPPIKPKRKPSIPTRDKHFTPPLPRSITSQKADVTVISHPVSPVMVPAITTKDTLQETLNINDALVMLSNIAGFQDFLLTRYAITGFTQLSPAYASDLHYAFIREVGHQHFYAIQNFDWRRVVDFTCVKRKSISALYHFTHISNLHSILENGILTRQQLDTTGQPFRYNDELRLDGVRNSISLSLGHVNNKMLYKYTKGLSDHEWVILEIKSELITGPLTPSFDHMHLLNHNVYCKGNAASSSVKAISIAERQKYSSFQAMFTNENGGEMEQQPYDVQAEILHLGAIPAHFISKIIFYSAENVPSWIAPSQADIVIDASRFSFR